VLCPADVMTMETEAHTYCEPEYAFFPAQRPRPGRAEIDAAAHMLASAQRPVIIAGGGSILSGASAEVVALAERLGAPVATTMNGCSSFIVLPSTDTAPSLMASRSADCVLGVVRLISSASTMFAKIGPLLNRNSERSRS